MSLAGQSVAKANAQAAGKVPETRTQFVTANLLWATPFFGFWLGGVFGFGLYGRAICSQAPELPLYGLLFLTFFVVGEIKILRLLLRNSAILAAMQIAAIVLLVQHLSFFARHQYAAVLAAVLFIKGAGKLLGRFVWGKALKAEMAAFATRQQAKAQAQQATRSRGRRSLGALAPPTPTVGGLANEPAALPDEPEEAETHIQPTPRTRASGLAERG